jgi:transcriptional regulator with XRE-family HTH domain
MLTGLRPLREQVCITQAELARRVGLSFNVVCQYESGARMPRSVSLPMIADALGCTIDALYGRGGGGFELDGSETMGELI